MNHRACVRADRFQYIHIHHYRCRDDILGHMRTFVHSPFRYEQCVEAVGCRRGAGSGAGAGAGAVLARVLARVLVRSMWAGDDASAHVELSPFGTPCICMWLSPFGILHASKQVALFPFGTPHASKQVELLPERRMHLSRSNYRPGTPHASARYYFIRTPHASAQ